MGTELDQPSWNLSTQAFYVECPDCGEDGAGAEIGVQVDLATGLVADSEKTYGIPVSQDILHALEDGDQEPLLLLLKAAHQRHLH